MANKKTVRGMAVKNANVVGDTVDTTCTECNTDFSVEIPDDATEGAVEATCPECGVNLSINIATGEATTLLDTDDDDDGEPTTETGDGGGGDDGTTDPAPGSVQNAVKAELAAERQRVKDLRGLKAAHPDHSDIVDKAEDEGWSYAKACRNVMNAVASAKKESDAKGGSFLKGARADATTASGVGAAPNSGTGDKVMDGISESVAMFTKRTME